MAAVSGTSYVASMYVMLTVDFDDYCTSQNHLG
jgi:hypothetical protein